MIKKIAFLILVMFAGEHCFSQAPNIQYNKAYTELKGMLQDSLPISFKKAVFETENAYLNGELRYEKFNGTIGILVALCKRISSQESLIYNEADKIRVSKYAAVYRILTDTVRFVIDSAKSFKTHPYKYDFEDFWGEKDWQKMFVTKLLDTNSGNCHSLPFLYKILCEELKEPAWLAMAPNHTYIKLWSKSTGWFNTELTGGYFPIDAWIMASGYIHLNAVRNKVYMDTLSAKQSIAVCLIDLAKGFEKKVGKIQSIDFTNKCTDLALQYYPNYANALLMKAENLKVTFEVRMKFLNVESPTNALHDDTAKLIFGDMERLYAHLHTLGYRTMPKDMYLRWLSKLNEEKDKYANKKILNSLNPK